MKRHTLFLTLLFVASFSHGSDNVSESLDYAQVTNVKVSQSKDGSWCFHTQVRHNDEGWDHYADAWQVIDSKGNVLGERVLFHPHDTEQPFTRSLCGVQLPSETSIVTVRAKCNLHGFGGQVVTVDLNASNGKNYSVTR
jgi:hypothetical protein